MIQRILDSNPKGEADIHPLFARFVPVDLLDLNNQKHFLLGIIYKAFLLDQYMIVKLHSFY